MSEEVIKRVKLDLDGTVWEITPDGQYKPAVGKTDWHRPDAMTEEEIEAAAIVDPDNPPSMVELQGIVGT